MKGNSHQLPPLPPSKSPIPIKYRREIIGYELRRAKLKKILKLVLKPVNQEVKQ